VIFALAADGEGEDKVKEDVKKLQGAWTVVDAEGDGKKFDKLKNAQFLFEGDKFTVTVNGSDEKSVYMVDPNKKPATFTFNDERNVAINGIYLLDGDNLKLCIRTEPKLPAPTDFKTAADSKSLFVTLKRAKR
jgi:uncharacterized protein (TIGR03067 family)